jgi:hypothetical protein
MTAQMLMAESTPPELAARMMLLLNRHTSQRLGLDWKNCGTRGDMDHGAMDHSDMDRNHTRA